MRDVVGIGVAAMASFIVNTVWYLVLFPDVYLESLGKTPEELAAGPSMLVASAMQLIGMAITATVLLYLIRHTGHTSGTAAMRLGLIVWFGLVAAVFIPMHAYQAYGVVFSAITSGSVLLTFLISCGILSIFARR